MVTRVIAKDKNYKLAHNYKVNIENGQIIRTPYHKEVTKRLKRELVNFDYYADYGALTKILVYSSEHDALTLHFLLSKVAPANREMVYQKLIHVLLVANLFLMKCIYNQKCLEVIEIVESHNS